MKVLRDDRVVSKNLRDGIRLSLDREGDNELPGRVGIDPLAGIPPLHIEVSDVTDEARKEVESAGGTVTKVYYNKLALRASTRPESFRRKGRALPKSARPPPRRITEFDKVGAVPAPESLQELPQLLHPDPDADWRLTLPKSAAFETQRMKQYLKMRQAKSNS